MQVLSIFVGKVLEFLWQRNTKKHKAISCLVRVVVHVWCYKKLALGTLGHLAVLMGLGSKLP